MKHPLAERPAQWQPRWQVALLGRSPAPPLMRWAFIAGSAAHLWLDDAWQVGWIPGDALLLLGMGLLLWRPCALAWLLCALGKALPLLLCRDHLTQSVLLLWMAGVGAGASAGSLLGDAARWQATWRRSWQGLTIITYLLATLHKINTDFFSISTSCANYGADKLAAYYHLPAPGGALAALLPWSVVLAEASIAGLYLLGRRRAALALAVSFHVPMTLALAPAFAFVMLAGHAAFVTPEDEAALRAIPRRSWLIIGGGAALALGISAALHRGLPAPDMMLKEWALYAILGVLGVLIPHRAPAPALRPYRGAVAAGLAVLLLNGLTPYLGVQFQHAGAMLSNLRVDAGCWNSLVIPEAARLTEDYIRVERASLRSPGFLPDYEASLREHLWSPPQLRQMRRRWCRPEVRPIRIEGTWRGAPFQIKDLCDDAPLPFPGDGILGVDLFPDALRFQKNLRRACPDACIH